MAIQKANAFYLILLSLPTAAQNTHPNHSHKLIPKSYPLNTNKMKRQLQPESEEARPVDVVVVASLTPAIGLMCIQPVDGYAAGTIRPVYGGNLAERSIYTNGHTPKDWRSTVDSGDYENEVIIRHLPDLMEELVPEDYPNTYALVLTDCKVIPMPTHTEPEVPTCRVIEHPAVKFAKVQPKARKPKDIAPGTLPMFPFAEINPLTDNQLIA